MTEFFSRLQRATSPEPVDFRKVQSDDALIESLRSGALFDDIDDGATLAERYGPSAGGPATVASPTVDDELAELFRGWRAEIETPEMPQPIELAVAVEAVRSAPHHRRAVRPMIAVAATIAGLLVGSAAIGSRTAAPDTPLFAVTRLLWADRAESALAVSEAREGIEDATQALEAGYPEVARVALERVTVVLTKVSDVRDRQSLESEYAEVRNDLDVATRTPAPVTTTTQPLTTDPRTSAAVTTTTTAPQAAPMTTVAPPQVPSTTVVTPPTTSDPSTTEPQPTPTTESTTTTQEPPESTPETTPETTPSETSTTVPTPAGDGGTDGDGQEGAGADESTATTPGDAPAGQADAGDQATSTAVITPVETAAAPGPARSATSTGTTPQPTATASATMTVRHPAEPVTTTTVPAAEEPA